MDYLSLQSSGILGLICCFLSTRSLLSRFSSLSRRFLQTAQNPAIWYSSKLLIRTRTFRPTPSFLSRTCFLRHFVVRLYPGPANLEWLKISLASAFPLLKSLEIVMIVREAEQSIEEINQFLASAADCRYLTSLTFDVPMVSVGCAIGRLVHLDSLTLTEGQSDWLSILGPLKALRSLEIKMTHDDRDDLDDENSQALVAALARLPEFSRLAVDQLNFPANRLEGLSQLRELSLHVRADAKGILDGLEHFPLLEVLSLKLADLNNWDFNNIPLPRMKTLQAIELDFHFMFTEFSILMKFIMNYLQYHQASLLSIRILHQNKLYRDLPNVWDICHDFYQFFSLFHQLEQFYYPALLRGFTGIDDVDLNSQGKTEDFQQLLALYMEDDGFFIDEFAREDLMNELHRLEEEYQNSGNAQAGILVSQGEAEAFTPPFLQLPDEHLIRVCQYFDCRELLITLNFHRKMIHFTSTTEAWRFSILQGESTNKMPSKTMFNMRYLRSLSLQHPRNPPDRCIESSWLIIQLSHVFPLLTSLSLAFSGEFPSQGPWLAAFLAFIKSSPITMRKLQLSGESCNITVFENMQNILSLQEISLNFPRLTGDWGNFFHSFLHLKQLNFPHFQIDDIINNQYERIEEETTSIPIEHHKKWPLKQQKIIILPNFPYPTATSSSSSSSSLSSRTNSINLESAFQQLFLSFHRCPDDYIPVIPSIEIHSFSYLKELELQFSPGTAPRIGKLTTPLPKMPVLKVFKLTHSFPSALPDASSSSSSSLSSSSSSSSSSCFPISFLDFSHWLSLNDQLLDLDFIEFQWIFIEETPEYFQRFANWLENMKELTRFHYHFQYRGRKESVNSSMNEEFSADSPPPSSDERFFRSFQSLAKKSFGRDDEENFFLRSPRSETTTAIVGKYVEKQKFLQKVREYSWE